MLKPFWADTKRSWKNQPPSGGCVLKPLNGNFWVMPNPQPPSGGCVLKHPDNPTSPPDRRPAAFRRLCVETKHETKKDAAQSQPPSGGCVLKQTNRARRNEPDNQPPSGGCVLKQFRHHNFPKKRPPAAFRRLCVETLPVPPSCLLSDASRLQAAVC